MRSCFNTNQLKDFMNLVMKIGIKHSKKMWGREMVFYAQVKTSPYIKEFSFVNIEQNQVSGKNIDPGQANLLTLGSVKMKF